MTTENIKNITRRDALKIGAITAGATAIAPRILQAASDKKSQKNNPPAKAIIEIWLGGGPSQQETFDPKPKAGKEYTGPLDKPIETNVKGMKICQLLPRLAKQADKYSLIRSMTHGINGHETAAYMMQTGRAPGGRLVYPSIGSLVSLFKGYDAGYDDLIPPFISLTRAKGRFAEAGFLGPQYKSFATGGNPSRHPFYVDGIISPGVSDARQQARRKMLENLNRLGKLSEMKDQLAQVDEQQAKAYELILGKERKLFDLRTEDRALRMKYGMNPFGQSCLMARRLVQRGVKYISVNLAGWDTHKRHFEFIRQRTNVFDMGIATLLEDLAKNNLLDSTVVWCSGEFGRTPKVMWNSPWNGGRGHYGKCFSALVAGGGFKAGKVLGRSDESASNVVERPVYPQELLGSILECVGIDPEAAMPAAKEKNQKIMPAKIGEFSGQGRLSEIMNFVRKA